MDDPYNYRATLAELDVNYLQRAFTHTGVLQIISQRSRPTAYEGQFTNSEPPRPEEMQPGIIDIKITKVGTLWRKAAKKKKARSPWQEWGAILTGSQTIPLQECPLGKGPVTSISGSTETWTTSHSRGVQASSSGVQARCLDQDGSCGRTCRLIIHST